MGGVRAILLGASLGMLLQAPACAKDLVRDNGRYAHRRLGFSIEDPTRRADGWAPVQVEGAELSFRGPGSARMSLVRKCGREVGDLRVLARQLLLGIEGPELLSEGPLRVDGEPAWTLTARAEHEGRAVHVKTVTLRLRGCSLDWVLVAPNALGPAEGVFDAWWGSFRATRPAAPLETAP